MTRDFRVHSRTLAVVAAAAALAAAAGARAGSTQPLSPQTIRHWTAVASCETGAGGAPKWDWGSKHRPGEGTLFEGGLGISAQMWQAWAGELGLLKQYPHAYLAPPLVQIRVAVYGATAYGASWGCK
jgi:hypothetical protein